MKGFTMKSLTMLLLMFLVFAASFTPAFAGSSSWWEGPGYYQAPGGNVFYFTEKPGGHSSYSFIGDGGIGGVENTFNPVNNNTNLGVNVGVNKNTNLNSNDNKNLNTNLNTNLNSNSNKVDVDVKNSNYNFNSQYQGQSQEQSQSQSQSMNNNQTIAPVQTNKQTVKIEKPFAPAPNVSAPGELNFGNGRMSDVTKRFPKFGLYGIKPLGACDTILEVISVTANEPFKRIYKVILSDGKAIFKEFGKDVSKIRYQIIEAEAQKSWTTGGSLAGSATGVLGATGAGGSGGLFPQVGGTKANFLYSVIFVKVE